MPATFAPSVNWTPRHGQPVLCSDKPPFAHVTKDGYSVGFYYVAAPVVNPATAKPYPAEAGSPFPMMSPAHVVLMQRDGRSVLVDRTNFKDFKGFDVLLPGKGLRTIGLDAQGEDVEKHFADNRLAELQIVCRPNVVVGPLLDRADMPPGRIVSDTWQPSP